MYSKLQCSSNQKFYNQRKRKTLSPFEKILPFVDIICMSICILVGILSMFICVSNINIADELNIDLKSAIIDSFKIDLSGVLKSRNAIIQQANLIPEIDAPSPTIHRQELEKHRESTVENQIGKDIISTEQATLIRHDTPDEYYPNIDYSSFQPYMGYEKITATGSMAYAVVNDSRCYTDELGLRRYRTTENQFTIDGEDDYVIALGTFYKEKGVVGNRYLIVTSTGMYTAITGDEKADIHTDQLNMFGMHQDGTKAGLIEWIVDEDELNRESKYHGTISRGGPEVAQGEILHIYEIK